MSYLKNELSGFVPKEQSSEIIKKVTRGSSVIRLSRAEPMTSETKKFPVMTSGAGAYWVGEGKRISTSGATWIFPELKAKKLAVIIPVTKEKPEDRRGASAGLFYPKVKYDDSLLYQAPIKGRAKCKLSLPPP